MLARSGENYSDGTLQFFLLLIKQISEESKEINRESRLIRMMEAQALVNVTKSEQVDMVQSTVKKVFESLLQGLQLGDKPKDPEKERLLQGKKNFMKDAMAPGKKFSSLSDILAAVGKSLNTEEKT